jgi:hypothetical protein
MVDNDKSLTLNLNETIVWTGRSAISITSIVLIGAGAVTAVLILGIIILAAGVFGLLNSVSLHYWVTNQRVVAIRTFPKYERVEAPISSVLRTRTHRGVFHRLRRISDFHFVISEHTKHDIVFRRIRNAEFLMKTLQDLQRKVNR